WNTALELTGTGGALCMRMPAANPNAFSSYSIGWDGINVPTKNTVKHAFYVQWLTYADSVYRDFYYGGTIHWCGKLAIIEAPDSSSDPAEVVIRRWHVPRGWVTSYYVAANGTTTAFELEWNNPLEVSSDFTYNNFLDNNKGQVVSVDTLQQRHGITYSDRIS